MSSKCPDYGTTHFGFSVSLSLLNIWLMKTKIYLLLLFGWGSITLHAQVSASLKYSIFPSGEGAATLLMVVGVDGKSLTYSKLDNGRYQATASFAITINDSIRNYFAERIDFQTPELPDLSQKNREFATTKNITLPSGSFKVQMLVFDPAKADTAKREKVEFGIQISDVRKQVYASDLMFLQNQGFDSGKPIVEQDPRVFRLSEFYAKTDTVISLYAQASGLQSKLPMGATLVSRFRILKSPDREPLDEFGRMQKLRVKETVAFKTDLNIRNLPSGNYLLSWDLVDSTSKVVARSIKEFQRSNPGVEYTQSEAGSHIIPSLQTQIDKMSTEECRLMVACLLPIAKASEQATISYLRKKGTDTEMRNYLAAFWTRQNSDDPASEMAEYQKRIAYASKYYTTQTMKAYETDRGRVYLQYGKPNLVENEQSDRFRKAMTNLNNIPYEVWYYYHLETPVKQNDVIFAFVQENRGNYNYRLLHSTGIGEVRNREWRKVVENNGTSNFDWQDPNDRYDPTDSKKFR